MAKPRMVYISNATEFGTVYTNMTLSDILELTDIFWIGGTKNGALLGEVVVVKDPKLASEFEFFVKRHESLLAKSRMMGAQFAELFRDNLYFELALHANASVEKLSSGITDAGFSVYVATETNQVFAVLPLPLISTLQEKFSFYVWEKCGDGQAVVRLLTTWATQEKKIEEFIGVVRRWGKPSEVRALF
ncbi:hypothetical protein QQZ08_007645 [Neonectria magnoliae]|uniref:Uncharacterized protein n=1 Tax=Neonectria magnoliae TaxID=2732573 RepID=A0ABR1HXZ8_9HYPO